ISTTLGQATPTAVQPSPSAIAPNPIATAPSPIATAPSPIATGDITTCSTCDKVKAACGSKFSLPQVYSQGTYIATGIVIIVRRHRKSRKIGDFPNISKPTKTKSLDILDNYNRKTRYSNRSNRSVDQFKEND
ncbi:5163_t:CDS:2, partial [Racocetra persica]